MKNIRILAATCALALVTGIAGAQQNGSPTTTAGDVESGTAGATTPKTKDTKNVRRARQAVPKQPAANTPGQQGNAHDIDNARNGTNAQVSGTPGGTAEENVSSAEANKNSDTKK